MKSRIIPRTDEENISVRFGCIWFIDSYRFLSGSLDSLVKTLVHNSHKTLKVLKEENVDNDEIKKVVNEMKKLLKEGRYHNDSIKGLNRDYPNKIEKLEEASLKYIGEHDLKILNTEFPDNRWKYLTKNLAYPYKKFNSLDDNQKLLTNQKRKTSSVN